MMAKESLARRWSAFLRSYAEQNAGRRTRIGIFEPAINGVNDYWLEDGLRLTSIDAQAGNKLPAISIRTETFSHTIQDAVRLSIHFGLTGDEDGLDVVDTAGNTTILRYED